MTFETIIPGGAPTPAPTPGPTPGPAPSGKKGESAAANQGTVSVEDALKGGDSAKMTQFSVSDLSKGPAGSAGVGGAGSSVALGGLLQGKMVVELMDSLLPSLLVLLIHRMGLETRKSQYQLTQGEKNTLIPVVEACMNSINLNFESPWTTLLVALAIIYGGKAAEVAGTAAIDKKTKETTPSGSVAPSKPIAPMKVVGGQSVKGPEPAGTQASRDTGSFPDAMQVVQQAQPLVWSEADVETIAKRRKKGKKDAVKWLENNYGKMGGVIG